MKVIKRKAFWDGYRECMCDRAWETDDCRRRGRLKLTYRDSVKIGVESSGLRAERVRKLQQMWTGEEA